MHAPSRRQSLLLLGSLGLAAAAGGAYMLENHGGDSSPKPTAFGRGRRRASTQDDINEGLEGQTNNETGETVPTLGLALADDGAWRPDAEGFQAVDDEGHQIKGFASATSINVGESIDFHVSVRPVQGFKVKVYRLGRSSTGKGSELIFTSPRITGTTQAPLKVVEPTRTVVAPWKLSYTLNVPNTWRGGLYVATLESDDKHRSCVPFVVREDGKPADLLVVLPFTTYQAYNMYPIDKQLGSSLYNAYLADGKEGGADICSTRVSFDRPYHQDGLPRLFELDQAFAQWAEAQPYTISYASSIDLHAGRIDPGKYKALVFSGHDEYWSPQMRTMLQGALTRGVSAAFMAANNVYWNIRLDASDGGSPDRQVTCYKRHEDPAAKGGVAPTVLWRDLNQPEQQTLGSMYTAIITDPEPQPLVVSQTGHWFWAGTSLKDGDQIPQLVAGEADKVFPHVKGGPKATVLASSPFTAEGPKNQPVTDTAQTVLCQYPSGAWVFDAGTFHWNHGLSTPGFADPRIQRATRNLLDRMTGKTGRAGTNGPAGKNGQTGQTEQAGGTGQPDASDSHGA
jgi:hypothetical protein